MFEEKTDQLLELNAQILEIEGDKLRHAAQGLQDSMAQRHKSRALHNLVQLKKSVDRINAKFKELEFLLP